jgi:1-acyl-sn-glycerol-3-phosphate acyltransferase
MPEAFDSIRAFRDDEVHAALRSIAHDPMMQTVLQFTFPELPPEGRLQILDNIRATQDFHAQVIRPAVLRILAESSAGLTHSGFDQLLPDTPYLYISNHRDIVLDTALLNFILLEQGLTMTASAIGDNLVKLPFLLTFAKINRNFLVRRNLPPRELLESSQELTAYIRHLMLEDRRSVWIAQREGRAKDGNDATNPGVLKMIGMAAGAEGAMSYLKKLRIVPVSISYEYDPADAFKIPELLAEAHGETYTKEPQEDFRHIMTGIRGQKKRIHFHAGTPLDAELDEIAAISGLNHQIKALAQVLDRAIVANYRLWPSNYISHDLLSQTGAFAKHYTPEEKVAFVQRMEERTAGMDAEALRCFLSMYARPVSNQTGMGH